MTDAWVDLLIDAPDLDESARIVRALVDALPNDVVNVGSGPQPLPNAPAPPRYVVAATIYGTDSVEQLKDRFVGALTGLSDAKAGYHEAIDLWVVVPS